MLEILCSNKKDGNMSSKYSMDGRDNRISFFKEHVIDYKRTICLRCKNKSIITEITEYSLNTVNESGDPAAIGDAFVTKEKDIFLFQMFGDCIPMVVYDKKKEILCLAHLGWIEAENNFMVKVINYFIDNLQSCVSDLKVVLGPSIKGDSYIIDKVRQIGKQEWVDYIKHVKDDFYAVDLEGYTVNKLKECGITNIEISPIDTYKDLNMFSNYRSNHDGEQVGRFLYGVRMK